MFISDIIWDLCISPGLEIIEYIPCGRGQNKRVHHQMYRDMISLRSEEYEEDDYDYDDIVERGFTLDNIYAKPVEKVHVLRDKTIRFMLGQEYADQIEQQHIYLLRDFF